MSSMVTGVLNLTVGLLFSKLRDHTANKLKGGDLTDEKCREMIVRELDDIKTKLDGLSRKDLLSSVSFLKEGLGLLELSQAAESTDGTTSFAQEPLKEDMMMAVAVGSSLSQGIDKLKIAVNPRFKSAKTKFAESNTEATRAFNNEALNIEDRIMATKLRVTSGIFQHFEDPDTAVVACMLYLKELHDLPAVREIFSVQLTGGMKSVFNKTKRLENVISVTMINFVVFDFAKKFAKIPVSALNWPTIEPGKRTYNPMITEGEILKKVEESGARSPNQFTLMKEKEIIRWIDFPQVNSKGEIIGVVNRTSGEVYKFTAVGSNLFSKIPQDETEANDFTICSLAIDEEDNVYIVTTSKQTNDVYNHKLFVFDAKGNMKHQSPLEFLNYGDSYYHIIAATKDMIVIDKVDEDRVYVCDSSGQLKYSFPLEKGFWKVHLSLPENEIIVAPQGNNVVSIYTEEGKLKKRFEVPEDHEVLGMAFNYVTKEIVVITGKSDNLYLSSYSETGELRRTFEHIPFKYGYFVNITSHPSGPVAIIYFERVIYIQ